ncbi:hypothetical protein ABF87_10355 [Nitrosomonas sp. JL21]|uniref:hypothetical protein n=1 Tax=Nitrosomonas sp. JL21 TaxID=153949 RepID=UPI001369C767|nr:hypothetical protein [Nitrosomonas sp. JL21]MBL8497703.1 hypothetical protein [Nitrosomonas sp.]MCC7091850.1 hypothetical protein [Nitrosomonas sp.]MXS78353.1 hypothetical protein [Nitrosomonas sp. JL21]
MKKTISFKSVLTHIHHWLTNKKKGGTPALDGAHINDTPANIDPSAETNQSQHDVKARYDRYYPLYLQDRDINSHF